MKLGLLAFSKGGKVAGEMPPCIRSTGVDGVNTLWSLGDQLDIDDKHKG